MGLQLLQLLAAIRSPRTTDEHDDRCPRSEYVCEPNLLTIAGSQCERWRRIANLEACHCLGHRSSSTFDSRWWSRGLRQVSYDALRADANSLLAIGSLLPPVPDCAMFVSSNDAAPGLPRFLANW